MTMKKFFTTVLALTLVLGTLLSLSACGNKLTMDKVGERLDAMAREDDEFFYSHGSGSDWERDFESEVGKNVKISNVYTLFDDDGYVLEFESKKDSKAVTREDFITILYFGVDRYGDWKFVREGNIIFFVHPDFESKLIEELE